MIIQGRFIGDAPYFALYLKTPNFDGLVWMLADTGASRTTLLDRDVQLLGIPYDVLKPATYPMVGIGGSVRSFLLPSAELTLATDRGDFVLNQDLWVVQHDLERLPAEEVSRILRLPSLLGRDLLNRFEFRYDYRAGAVELSQS